MVNSISGQLTFKGPDYICVSTGGIEWSLEATGTTVSSLPKVGEDVKVYAHLHHTQDQMKLFGFYALEERITFHALLTVNGVGPSLARKILSGTTPKRFAEAVEAEDISALGSIPGLGKKTAQKIVLQLKGKIVDEDSSPGSEGSVAEVVEALSAMGFDSRGAGRAVAAILADPEIDAMKHEEREKEILRRAIVALSS